LLLNVSQLFEVGSLPVQTSCCIRKLVLRNHKLVRSPSRSSFCACGTAWRANHELVCCSNLNHIRKLMLRNRKLVLHIRKLVRSHKLVLHNHHKLVRNHKLVRSPCRSSYRACGTVSTASHIVSCCSMNRKLVLRSRKLVQHNRMGLRSHKLGQCRNKHRSCYNQTFCQTGGPPKRPLS